MNDFMAANTFGYIKLDLDDLELSEPALIYLLLHEANHSKQLRKSFFDWRRFCMAGRKAIELEATLDAARDMAGFGFGIDDFIKWELDMFLLDKYGVDREGFINCCKRIIKYSSVEKLKGGGHRG